MARSSIRSACPGSTAGRATPAATSPMYCWRSPAMPTPASTRPRPSPARYAPAASPVPAVAAMDSIETARSALAELDKALAAKPKVDGHTLSAAAHNLSLLRDSIAERQREQGQTPDSRRRLEHVNAVISVVLGVHFPLGSVPWDELEKARGWLAKLADDESTQRMT